MFENKKMQELTPRQREILTLLRKGLTNNEICKTLNISANTVKVHLANIYKILEVTNRTEAVSAGLEVKDNDEKESSPKDLVITFQTKGTFPEHSNAYSLYLSIVEALHQYHLFRIIDESETNVNPSFLIEVSASESGEEILYISVKIGNSHEILWTTSIKINSDTLQTLAQKSTILLFRSIVLASAKLKHTENSPIPYWWYAATYCYAKLENRSQESFEICKKKLGPLVKDESFNDFALYILASAYYFATLENWGNAIENAKTLGDLARKAMYNAPYSIYSQMIMAFYNITIGNKAEAIAYLKQVIEANPQAIMPRTILSQIYLLTGQEKLATELIDDCIKHVPESALQHTHQAKTFLLLLQGKIEECKNLANQVLLFTPKAMAIRLIIIACCNILGETDESKSHAKKLLEYYPNLTKGDVEQLLKGVTESKKNYFLQCVQSIFANK
ncbi:regulatory protein, luxR family [Fibrobacter sp. UWB12]|nr:regulatory protein, luxR family [Fibrobacter sp. UWB12]